jgi:hypothetical protein
MAYASHMLHIVVLSADMVSDTLCLNLPTAPCSAHVAGVESRR